MILQPTAQILPPNSHQKTFTHLQFSSSLSVSSGLVQNSSFFLKLQNLSTAFKIHNNPAVITCSSVPHDYENRPPQKWNTIYKKLSMSNPNSDKAAASVLNQTENEGKRISKWELARVIKELRTFKRFELAFEVYDWMTNRAERFRVTTSDTSIQLDLIAKVHGVSKAEQYFQKLPHGLKDKRITLRVMLSLSHPSSSHPENIDRFSLLFPFDSDPGSLLNAYARAKMSEEAESLIDKIKTRGLKDLSFRRGVSNA